MTVKLSKNLDKHWNFGLKLRQIWATRHIETPSKHNFFCLVDTETGGLLYLTQFTMCVWIRKARLRGGPGEVLSTCGGSNVRVWVCASQTRRSVSVTPHMCITIYKRYKLTVSANHARVYRCLSGWHVRGLCEGVYYVRCLYLYLFIAMVFTINIIVLLSLLFIGFVVIRCVGVG